MFLFDRVVLLEFVINLLIVVGMEIDKVVIIVEVLVEGDMIGYEIYGL